MAKKESVKKTKKTTKKVVTETVNENIAAFETPIEEVADKPIVEEKQDILNDEVAVVEEPQEEIIAETVEEKITEKKNKNNERATQRVDNSFWYLWNGQEMDY